MDEGGYSQLFTGRGAEPPLGYDPRPSEMTSLPLAPEADDTELYHRSVSTTAQVAICSNMIGVVRRLVDGSSGGAPMGCLFC